MDKYTTLSISSQELISLFEIFKQEDRIAVLESLLILSEKKRVIPFAFDMLADGEFQKKPLFAWKTAANKDKYIELMKSWIEVIADNFKEGVYYQGTALVLDDWDLAVVDVDDTEKFSNKVMCIDEFLSEISQSALMIEKSLRKGYHVYVEKSYLLEKLGEFPNNKKLLDKYGFEIRHKDLLICYPSMYNLKNCDFKTEILSVNIHDRKETEALFKIIDTAKSISDKKKQKVEEEVEVEQKIKERIEQNKYASVKVEITKDAIRQIKERAKFSDFMTPAHDYGKYQTYHCPFHPPDLSPSFTVYQNQEGEYAIDLHDHERYDIISFYQKLYFCDFITAIKELAERYGVELQIIEEEHTEEQTKHIEDEGTEEQEQEEKIDWIQEFEKLFGKDVINHFPLCDRENPDLIWAFDKGNLVCQKMLRDYNKEIMRKQFFIVTHLLKDNQDKVLAYRVKKWDGRSFDIQVGLQKDELDELFNTNGIFVGAGKAKLLTSYVATYTELYQHKIPSVLVLDSIGWHDNDYYVPQISKINIEIKNQKGYEAVGDKQKEIELMKKLMNSHLGLGYVFGFASTLIYLLKTKNIVAYIQGANGRGKTTMANISLSIWGDYDKLGQSINSTRVGKEISMAAKKDRVILLDELNTASAKDRYSEVATLIYEYVAGEGRERATKYLELREKMTYRGVLLITAELDFDTLLEKAVGNVNGAVRRTIFVDMSIFDNIENQMFSEIYDTISNHHGNLIESWISFLKRKERKDIEEIFKNYAGMCVDRGLANGMDRNFALLFTTLELMKEAFNVETEEMKKIIERIAEDNTGLLRKRSTLDREKLEEMIYDFIHENAGKGLFYEKVVAKTGDTYTALEKKNVQELWYIHAYPKNGFYFTAAGLRGLAEHIKMPEKLLKKLLIDFGMCEADKDRIAKRTNIRFKEMMVKVYFIKLSQEQLQEPLAGQEVSIEVQKETQEEEADEEIPF